MYYPLNLLVENVEVHPLFGDLLKGEPHVFDFSSNNPKTLEMGTDDFDSFQKVVLDELAANGKSWGVGRYLEERASLLRNYDMMIRDGRVYHAGMDVMVPAGAEVYAPLAGKVFHVGVEEELGSYGGHIVLEHQVGESSFYAIYGHLNSDFLVSEGQILAPGELFARIGERRDSGGWFTHTHLQIITQEACRRGRMFHGYVTAEDLKQIENLFPSPYLLFRV